MQTSALFSLQLPNVLGFIFGVIQMGLYAIYRNATPRVPAKEVADDKEDIVVVKVPEHVVTIAKLGAPAVELKTHEVRPAMATPTADAGPENDKAVANKQENGTVPGKGSNTDQV